MHVTNVEKDSLTIPWPQLPVNNPSLEKIIVSDLLTKLMDVVLR